MGKDTESELRLQFERLCREHEEAARRLIRRKLGASLRRRVDSQDVLNESLLEAWRLYANARKRPVPGGKGFMRWLGKIIDHRVKSLVRFHLKARKRTVLRESRLDSGDGADRHRGAGRTASSILVEAEEHAELRRALLKLSPKQKLVIQLVHFEKLGVSDAAARLNKTANATSVLLYDALQKLGTILRKKKES